jgi:hypothetical protein
VKTILQFRITQQLQILFILFILTTTTAYADNKVLGEVVFEGATSLEQDSGVWVDGQYVGYLKELNGIEEGTAFTRETRDIRSS